MENMVCGSCCKGSTRPGRAASITGLLRGGYKGWTNHSSKLHKSLMVCLLYRLGRRFLKGRNEANWLQGAHYAICKRARLLSAGSENPQLLPALTQPGSLLTQPGSPNER